MEAILDSAEALFSKRGVNVVSYRDIAAKANVNHGLIHRHFGSKENLRRAVQNRFSKKIREEIGEPRDERDGFRRGLLALQNQKSYWKLMARTILDEDIDGDIQSEFPYVRTMTLLVEKAQQEGRLKDDLDPRVIVAGVLALSLGMLMFERYILPGVGLQEESSEAVICKITSAWLDLLNTSALSE